MSVWVAVAFVLGAMLGAVLSGGGTYLALTRRRDAHPKREAIAQPSPAVETKRAKQVPKHAPRTQYQMPPSPRGHIPVAAGPSPRSYASMHGSRTPVPLAREPERVHTEPPLHETPSAPPPTRTPAPPAERPPELDPALVAATWHAGLDERSKNVEVLFAELLAARGIPGQVEAILSDARRTVAVRVACGGRGWIVPDFDAQLLQLDEWFDAAPGSNRSAWVATLHRPAVEEHSALTRGLVG